MPDLTIEQLRTLRIAAERLLELPEAEKWDARGHERRADEAKLNRAAFNLLNDVNKNVGIRGLVDLVRRVEASAEQDGRLAPAIKETTYAALMAQIPRNVLEEHVPKIVEVLARAATRSLHASRALLGLEGLTKSADFEYSGPAQIFEQQYPTLTSSVERYMADAVGNHAQAVTSVLVDAANPKSPMGIDALQHQLRSEVAGLTTSRATTIARTETARVYGETARATFRENQIARARLVTAGNPCPVCEEIASRGLVPLDELEGLPIHPNCRCDYIPDVEDWLPPLPEEPAGGEFRSIDPSDPGSFDRWINKEQFPGASAFTKHEVTFIREYKDHSGPVNDALRGNPEGAAYAISQIDSAMAKHQLSENMTLYRGIRGGGPSEVGHFFSEKAYMSTSLNMHVAKRFAGHGTAARVLELRVPKGTNALSMGRFGPVDYYAEYEILLPRNTMWRVVSADAKRIVLEMVK